MNMVEHIMIVIYNRFNKFLENRDIAKFEIFSFRKLLIRLQDEEGWMSLEAYGMLYDIHTYMKQ